MPPRIAAFALLLLLAVSSCRFRDLTPGSSRKDEATLQGAVTGFYQALATRDTVLLRRVSVAGATALLPTADGLPVLVPLRTAIDVPERRNQSGGGRVVRTDPHPDGDVALERVVIAARSADGSHEYEATDALTLTRRASGWRIAHALFGPWRSRTAP